MDLPQFIRDFIAPQWMLFEIIGVNKFENELLALGVTDAKKLAPKILPHMRKYAISQAMSGKPIDEHADTIGGAHYDFIISLYRLRASLAGY